ncbi:ATP-dependent DNA ligase [Streptomyces massasporeus]
MVEIAIAIARDASGRWRHPAHLHHPHPDLSPNDIPSLTSPPR